VQGIGAGAIMSINGAMVRHIVPADGIGRGIATISLVVGISAAAGPTIAGAILSVASWHWLFLINVPICLGILASGALTLPRIAGRGNRFDIVSATLNALAFGLLIYALSGFGRGGSVLLSVLELAAASLAFAALIRRQKAVASPLLPTDLLAHRPFALSISASITAFAAQFLALVSLPFFLHDVLGRSPAETGLLLTPWPIAVAAAAPIAGRLADLPYRAVQSVAGMGIFALGFVLIAALPADPSNADIMWRLALCGLGFALFTAPNNRTIMTSAPLERSGGASGMMSVARVFGQSCGAAIAASLIVVLGGFDIVPLMFVSAAFALCAAALGGLRSSSAA
jgi:DHA2 family multidrug resistance protein-like MFS transporter